MWDQTHQLEELEYDEDSSTEEDWFILNLSDQEEAEQIPAL